MPARSIVGVTSVVFVLILIWLREFGLSTSLRAIVPLMILALWFSLPVIFLWKAQPLARKIGRVTVGDPEAVQVSSVATVGWLAMLVQLAAYLLWRSDWAWLYLG